MNKNLLIVALIFAGCALAGHSLLKPEPIRWQLTAEQPQITTIIKLQKIPQYTYMNRLIVQVNPTKNAASTQAHSFAVGVFCEGSDHPLQQQILSTHPAASGEKFIVQLPSELEQCFNQEAIAQLKINLSITPPEKNTAFIRKGEFYIQ